MFCPHCGATLNPQARFCGTCGNNTDVPPPGGAVPPAPIPPGTAPPYAQMDPPPYDPNAAAYMPPVAYVPAPFIPPPGGKADTGRWIGQGWDMVKSDLTGYCIVALVLMVLNGVVPLILQGPMLVGFHIYIVRKMLYGRAEIGDLFKGFNYFVPSLVASIVIGLFAFAGSLLCFIPGLIVAAMYMFSYMFIVDKRMDFWPAMQASHAVVKNDYLGFTLFFLALAALNICGALACIVGLLVTIPLSHVAITLAYRDLVGFEPNNPW